MREETTAYNSGFKKLAVQWLIEHLCLVSSLVLADSFVLRNPPLRQTPNRWWQWLNDTANIDKQAKIDNFLDA